MEKAFGIILKERRSKQLYRKKHGQEKEKIFREIKTWNSYHAHNYNIRLVTEQNENIFQSLAFH